MVGQRLAHYEITAKLGEGGMGEVYRATDAKLEREVALKVLPESFAADQERLERFEREAKVLASLNHSGIAGIYSLEEANGLRFLTMELVAGEALDARLKRGALPVEEAVDLARQMALALEAAHEQGIVHRDLKPANVMVTPDSEVKILDFGLAKAVEPSASGSNAILTQSPTITHQMTQAGVLMGTAAYMSPEQARGQEADKRSDIWAFGVMLFELLTGESSFSGETVSDTLAAILTRDPDFERLPDIPIELRRLLERCLDRDPKQRLRDIGEARITLERLKSGEAFAPAVAGDSTAQSRVGIWVAALVLASLAAGVVGFLARRGEGVAAEPMRLSIHLAPNQEVVNRGNARISFAPDGKSLLFPCREDGAQMLCRRVLEEAEAQPIEGTENGNTAFFSPDGRWIGFEVAGRLKKVAVEGGRPFDLGANSAGAGGAAWLADGTLVFAPIYSDGLFRIEAEGGDRQRLTTPDREAGVLGHWWPTPLPGDRKVVFTAFRAPVNRSRIGVLDLDSGRIDWLVDRAFHGLYSPSGHLLYTREGRLYALPLDPKTATATGPAIEILDNVYHSQTAALSMVAVSSRGALAYVAKELGDPLRELTWIDLDGRSQPAFSERRRFSSLHLSPDGRSVALTVEQENIDLWILSLESGALSRLTTAVLTEFAPTWSHDGRELFYVVDVPPFQLFRMGAGSPDTGRPIWEQTAQLDAVNIAVAPDGEWLAFSMQAAETGENIYVRAMDDRGPAEVFRAGRAAEVQPSFSPDGRWLAYQSDETGRPEIYVEPFPGPGERFQITADGGSHPVWARTGEVFHRHRNELRSIRTRTDGAALSFDPPVTVSNIPIAPGSSVDGQLWDVTADGKRILAITVPDADVPRRIELLTNWTSRLASSP